jgi:hypothetical protein
MQCINLTQYRQSQYRITNRWISHESTSSKFQPHLQIFEDKTT